MNPTQDPKRRGLGRGLSALLGDEAGAETPAEASKRPPTHLPIAALRPGRFQPRTHFDEEEMAALTQSIRAQGILQPILVRRLADEPGAYEIVAGERRWRAAQAVPLHEVPVILRELNDGQALELALVENLQRQDLGALEEAEGFRRLMLEFSHTQEDLARVVGRSRSHVANMMRLLDLPEAVKALLSDGSITAGHARALLTAREPARLAKEVVRKRLNVRQTEQLAGREFQRAARAAKPAPGKDSNILAMEHDLGEALGLKAEIEGRGPVGRLVLYYGSFDQLEDLCDRLRGEPGGVAKE
jgi:ParB family chromosome partitioning protein